ncbi:MAG: acetate--CoA ligase family protein [Betaproteobacteria bacterium]|nr:acetate--CoA ligase family protein [Betaproteobacteria bacterium]
MTTNLYQAVFDPRSIALIGASSDEKKNTSRPQRYLKRHGYAGKIIPVNPGRDEVFGEKAYPDVASIPGEVDHAFVMVPAKAVAAAVKQCVDKKIPVVTVYSDGFAETGEAGRARQQELVDLVRGSSTRLVGPNCIGLMSTQTHLALSVNAVLEKLEITPGGLAIVSQSGSMMGGLMSRGLGRGVGFSKLISVGNEADLGVGELAGLLVDDPHTEAILLFMETIRDAKHLAEAARRAYAASKPVIVYKLGRSEVGQDLAASHTGAMAGADEAVDAFFRAHGMLRVDTLEALFELPALVKGRKPNRQHRVAAMTTTGGGAACVVDRIGTFGVDVVGPTDAVVNALAQKNITINQSRITDLTLAGAKKEIYGGVLNALLASDHCDLVLAVAGSSAQFQPQIAVEPMVEADRRGKAMAVFLAPHAEASLKLLASAGVAGFRTPESCADSIRAWKQWVPPVDIPQPDAQKTAAAGALLKTATGKQLNEQQACAVFGALGVPQAQTAVMADAGAKVEMTYPVVAKILSPDIAHKTDAGGVVLNINDAAQLKQAAEQIFTRVKAKHPQAKLNGILVQRMERGLAEVIVGFKRDPQVGPLVVIGVGGVLAEIYKDFAMRLAPVTPATALQMIEEVKGLAVIRGYRGMTKGDCKALAQAVAAFSQLAAFDDIAEAEINPLIVRKESEGVVAVDGLIVRR